MNDETIHTVGNDSPARPRGIPLWLLIMAVLLIAGVGIAALATTFIKKTDAPARVAAVVARGSELLRDGGGATRNDPAFAAQQKTLLDSAAQATNAVVDALAMLHRVREDADALLTNDTGRLVARNEALVAQAQRLYLEELPKLTTFADLAAKLVDIRQMETVVTSATDNQDIDQAEFNSAVQNTTVLAGQSIQQTYPVRMLLASLIEEARFRPDTRTNPEPSLTLAATLGRRLQEQHISQKERAEFQSYMKAIERIPK